MVALVPFAFQAGGALDARASDVQLVLGSDVEQAIAAGDPFVVGPLRALDPELDADLLMAAFAAQERAALTGDAPAATTSVAAEGRAGSAARRKATATRVKTFKGWRLKKAGPWRNSPLVTWYGPGFYGNRTACGQRYTRHIVGVAHRTLPCGTIVQFRWGGRTALAPVIDRGPYGPRKLVFDWSAGFACRTFKPRHAPNGCFTRANVHYRVVGKVSLKQWFAHKRAMRRKH